MRLFMIIILAAGSAFGFDHSAYDILLEEFVDNSGLLQYQGLKSNVNALDRYLDRLEQVSPDSFQTWPENEQLAFWINAYNALMLKAVINQYPLVHGGMTQRGRFPQNSIGQIDSVWQRIWSPIMGKELTLNDIRNDILPNRFEEPRLFTAIVCGSASCPKLQPWAYTGEELDTQLEEAAREFVTDPRRNRLNREKKTLYLSTIFKKYSAEFKTSPRAQQEPRQYDKTVRGAIEFVLRYLPTAEAEFVKENNVEVEFLDKDQRLDR